MPARNSLEKVINDLNKRSKPFGLSVSEVESYQNVRKSKISLIDAKNQTKTKSLEKWREFFDAIEGIENAQVPILFEEIHKPTLKERVFAKALKLNHRIDNFNYPNYKDATCTVYCNTHQQTYENVHATYYILPQNKFGVVCCSSAFRDKNRKIQSTG